MTTIIIEDGGAMVGSHTLQNAYDGHHEISLDNGNAVTLKQGTLGSGDNILAIEDSSNTTQTSISASSTNTNKVVIDNATTPINMLAVKHDGNFVFTCRDDACIFNNTVLRLASSVPLELSNSSTLKGTPGQVIKSNGSNGGPVWTHDVNLSSIDATHEGDNELTIYDALSTSNISADTVTANSKVSLQTGAPLELNSDQGTAGQVMKTNGSNSNPTWTYDVNLSSIDSTHKADNELIINGKVATAHVTSGSVDANNISTHNTGDITVGSDLDASGYTITCNKLTAQSGGTTLIAKDAGGTDLVEVNDTNTIFHNTTDFRSGMSLSNGTGNNGQVLVSQGASAPKWSNNVSNNFRVGLTKSASTNGWYDVGGTNQSSPTAKIQLISSNHFINTSLPSGGLEQHNSANFDSSFGEPPMIFMQANDTRFIAYPDGVGNSGLSYWLYNNSSVSIVDETINVSIMGIGPP